MAATVSPLPTLPTVARGGVDVGRLLLLVVLGVARSTLFKRLKDWGMTRHDEAPPPAPSA